MLIGVSGTLCSGRSELVRFLQLQGFEQLILDDSLHVSQDQDQYQFLDLDRDLAKAASHVALASHKTFTSANHLLDYATTHWRDRMVVTLSSPESLNTLSVRPFFLHVALDAPIMVRFKRYCRSHPDATLQDFVTVSDSLLYESGMHSCMRQAQVSLINASDSLQLYYLDLGKANLTDPERLRPSWDSYFMRLAGLAALRSNCMKRRVGAVIVRNNRVVATGYNGTPRGLTNCAEGGCERCNKGLGSGNGLGTCLCLHAEENALLEAGRDRLVDTVLYCNTCPCLTCTIKIVQCGIKEVVYSQSYSMDAQSLRVMQAGGVVMRQFNQ